MSSSSSTDANVMVSNTPIKSRRVHQTGKRRRISNEHSPITKLSLDELSVDEAKLLLKDAETVLENDELVRLADNGLYVQQAFTNFVQCIEHILCLYTYIHIYIHQLFEYNSVLQNDRTSGRLR
jgi:hypothetical protein